jgi:hypothetical protein
MAEEDIELMAEFWRGGHAEDPPVPADRRSLYQDTILDGLKAFACPLFKTHSGQRGHAGRHAEDRHEKSGG